MQMMKLNHYLTAKKLKLNLKITFLGTGTSQGVPMITCECKVCQSPDQRDKRYRSSVLIEVKGKVFVIDTGPDFRNQMLENRVMRLDGILITHSHKDHVAGLDDVRAYNYHMNKAMDLYATEDSQAQLKREFEYVFNGFHYPGIPQINLHTISLDPFEVAGVPVIPIRVMHYKLPVLGFRIGNFAYITDANHIEPEEMQKIKGVDVLVLNALRHEKHISHFTLEEAIAVAQESNARQTYFTHISHQLGLHAEVDEQLPAGINLAHDRLSIEIADTF